MRFAAKILALTACLLALAPAVGEAEGPRAGAALNPPPSLARRVSAADRRAWHRAIVIANRSAAVHEQRARYPGLRSTSFAPLPGGNHCCMEVWYSARGKDRAAAKVNLRTGAIREQWTGWQADWDMARGYKGDFGRIFNSPWVFVPLGLLFLIPFVDPRRPLRMLHLDLLVMLAFGVSHVLFNQGRIGLSVPLAYPVLLYLLVRMVLLGFRPSPEPRGALVPHVPVRWLAIGAVLLFGGRVALNVVDSGVVDIGYAGVIGAHHIAEGQELYNGHFAKDPPDGDTYGPLTYVAYLPFERLIGWSGKWDDVPAAHGAAIAFDLLVMVGLFLLGRRLRGPPEGTALGTALAFAWAAYPYSLFVLATNSNDALVAMLVVFALVALTSAPARGALVGLGAAAKLAPLALAPLFFNPRGERRLRGPILFTVALVAVIVAAVAPFVPPGGLHQLYDRTLGFQVSRESPFSIWGQDPSLDSLHTVVQIAAVNFAVVLLLIPAAKSLVQVAALAAAVLIALELATVHWFYLYIVWFAPLVLVALFARHEI